MKSYVIFQLQLPKPNKKDLLNSSVFYVFFFVVEILYYTNTSFLFPIINIKIWRHFNKLL